EAELDHFFPVLRTRTPFIPRCIVTLTSTFDRNMYRYREPRTYRTVHMDAGHTAGSARILANACGWNSALAMSDNSQAIEQYLGLDPMVEGYMMSVALAEGEDIRDRRLPHGH
ncbi:MAG TPA: hypothetical protein VGE93_09185, partial [Bryobacteraceae bacterium]